MSSATLKKNVKHIIKKNTFFVVPNERTFLYRHLMSFANTLKGKKILDVGVGHQEYNHLFEKDNQYEVCDLKRGFRQDKRPDFYSSVYDITKENKHYDVVLLIQVLEHLEYPLKALKEIRRVLRDDGIVYISTPQAAGDHFKPYHYFNYTQFGLQSILRESGFKVLEHQRLAGSFWFAGNAMMKLGQVTRKQFRQEGNMIQKVLAAIFDVFCYWLGYFISLFNFIDRKKDNCIGNIVIAQRTNGEHTGSQIEEELSHC